MQNALEAILRRWNSLERYEAFGIACVFLGVFLTLLGSNWGLVIGFFSSMVVLGVEILVGFYRSKQEKIDNELKGMLM